MDSSSSVTNMKTTVLQGDLGELKEMCCVGTEGDG